MYEDIPYDRRPSLFAKLFLCDNKLNGFAVGAVFLFFIEVFGISSFVLINAKYSLAVSELYKIYSAMVLGGFTLSAYITYRIFRHLRKSLRIFGE